MIDLDPDDAVIVRITRSNEMGDVTVRIDYNRQWNDQSQGTIRIEARQHGIQSGVYRGELENIVAQAGRILQYAREQYDSEGRGGWPPIPMP